FAKTFFPLLQRETPDVRHGVAILAHGLHSSLMPDQPLPLYSPGRIVRAIPRARGLVAKRAGVAPAALSAHAPMPQNGQCHCSLSSQEEEGRVSPAPANNRQEWCGRQRRASYEPVVCPDLPVTSEMPSERPY